MITNLWSSVKLICGNHGEDSGNEMELKQSPSSNRMYYICPKSISENRTPGESQCRNIITLLDFEHMLKHLEDVLCDGYDNGIERNLTNYRWTKDGIKFRVLKHHDDSFVISVINKKMVVEEKH